MTCTHCKQEIPAGALVCPCFIKRQDNELERAALTRFAEGGNLYLTAGRHHLLPRDGRGLTLCREKRFERASCIPMPPEKFLALTQKDCCIACAAKATRALGPQVNNESKNLA